MHFKANTRMFCLLLAVLTALLPLFSTALAAERYQVMREGDEDEYVLALQKKLYELGYLTVKPTGYYGSATVEAVKKFQQKKGLTADGIAGIATQKALYGSSYEPIPSSRKVSDDTKTAATASASSSSSSKRYQVLMYGDEDEYVKKLQQALYDAGYLKAKPTGYFGEATLEAVIAFQKKKGLTADGIAGVATQKALYGKAYTPIPSTRKIHNAATSEDADGDFESIRKGDAGALVQSVQQRLKKYGYFEGDVTSYFGSATEAAVKAFQKNNGLKADGVVGSETYSLLFSGSPKSAPKKSSAAQSANTAGASAQTDDDEVDLGSESDIAIIEEAIRYAASFLGTPYKYGGKGPKNFDCSGFTAYVLRHVGVDASTSSKAQGNNDKWPKISYKNLKRGDLLIFTNTKLSAIGHVGIYLGDGRFIHCSSGSAKSVTISHLEGTYLKRFLWGRRWVAEADPSVLELLGDTESGDDTPPQTAEDAAEQAAEQTAGDGAADQIAEPVSEDDEAIAVD